MFSYIIMCGILYPVFANPSPTTFNEKKVTNEVNWQLTLLSIEEKLRNLESFVIVECGSRFNGKLDYYGRKIDNIEKTLSKMEMQTKLELEKISENISGKNFKEDMGNERIIRNIDIIHEKLNHRLAAIEQRTDLSTIKMKNIGETLTARLEKIEENFMIRDSDIETELSEVATAIDDLKSGYASFEENTMNLITQSTEKLLRDSENLLTRQYTQMETVLDATNKNVSKNMESMQEMMETVLIQTRNATEIIGVSKEEMFDNLNEYANKIIDIHTDLWQKTDSITSKVHQLSKTANLSRNEQQNSLRGLTVQLGRLSGKPQIQSDFSAYDHGRLEELEKKMDENFQHIMLTQSMFLESCHRVQMDEAQIESQIGIVLNKLIDIFENKTSVSMNDIQRLEHSIHTHDSNMKHCLQNTLSNLQDLFKVIREEHVKIVQNMNKQKESIGIMNVLLKDISHSQEGGLAQSVLNAVKDLEKQVVDNSNILNSQNNITKLLLKINLQENFNFSTLVSSITTDLNVIKEHTNTCFLQKEHVANIISTLNLDKHANIGPNIANLITEIFGPKPDTSILDKEHFKITRTEIEKLIASLNSTGLHYEKIDNYTYKINKPNELQMLNCVPHYIDLIDVRYNANDELLNCTVFKTTNKEKAHNCLPNYLDVIDVRFNRENYTNCINAIVTTETTRGDIDSEDIHFNSESTDPPIKVAKPPIINDITQQVTEDWDDYPEQTITNEEEGQITFQNNT